MPDVSYSKMQKKCYQVFLFAKIEQHQDDHPNEDFHALLSFCSEDKTFHGRHNI